MNNHKQMIDPDREYTLKQIRDGKFIPWATHYQTLKKIIVDDFFGKNKLKSVRKGEGRGMRYTIRGAELIKYRNEYAKKLMV